MRRRLRIAVAVAVAVQVVVAVGAPTQLPRSDFSISKNSQATKVQWVYMVEHVCEAGYVARGGMWL